ncbi:MAG: DUF3461 family protein [Motiliproteus sp.]
MSLFPTLTSMGVTSFDQISRYTLHSADAEESLKIYYQRPDTSPLPRTKNFKFPRTDNGSGSTSSARLLQAVTELNGLTSSNGNPERNRQQLVDELEQLEQVMLAKTGELRRRLADWR